MARIAYFILCHKEPERVARLVNQLQTDSDVFRIHFDNVIGKRQYSEWKRIIEQQCPCANLEIASKFRCRWGSFGGVKAALSAIQQCKTLDYDYFVNLSGECYPIKPTHIIKKAFDGQTSAYIEAFELPTRIWGNGGMKRLQYRYYFLSLGKHSKLLRIPRLSKELPCNLKPYGGSAFFCLPKQQANYVVEFIGKNPSVRKFFEHANLTDEIFFQTVLMNSPFQSTIINDNKRYIDWSRSIDGHPKCLTISDLEAMLKSDKLFARKFNLAVDKDILDSIDQKIAEWAS